MIIFETESKYFDKPKEQEFVKNIIDKIIVSYETDKLKNIVITNKIPEREEVVNGITLPRIFGEEFYIIIKFADGVIDKINNEVYTIHHELCHYLWLKKFYSNPIHLKYRQLGQEQLKKEDLLFDLGLTMVTEYHAFRNSFSFYSELDNHLLLYYARKSYTNLQAFKIMLEKNNTYQQVCNIYHHTEQDIDKLFYQCCKELAHYHISDRFNSIAELDLLRKKYNYNNWIKDVSEILKFTYDLPIHKIQENDFINVGEVFFKIYLDFGINLTNKDGKIHFHI